MRNGKFVPLGTTLAVAMALAACGDKPLPPPAADAAPAAPASVGTKIDDTVITTKVKSALLADPDIQSFNLKVETFKGTVQLSGFVDSAVQVERALAVARGVTGVAKVDNNVIVKEGSRTVG